MKNVLVLFVISPNPGPYINTMAHAMQYHGVDKVVVVEVVESPTAPLIADFKAFVNSDLWQFIDDLSKGTYRRRDSNGQFIQEALDLPEDYPIYRQLRELFAERDQASINYQYLRKHILELKQRYRSAEILADITGAPKRLAADILAACLAARIESIFTFELDNPRQAPELLLYHRLRTQDYEHVVLPNSAPLVANLTLFSMNQNRPRLLLIATVMLVSVLLAILSYQSGSANITLTAVLVLINVIGGLLPLVDILLGTGILREWM